jgi:hypothetical protein
MAQPLHHLDAEPLGEVEEHGAGIVGAQPEQQIAGMPTLTTTLPRRSRSMSPLRSAGRRCPARWLP